MSTPERRTVRPAPWLILGAFAAILLLRPFLPEWAVAPPEAWTLPFTDWINVATDFLRTEPLVLGVTFKDFTRFVADMVQIPLNLMEGVLFAGFKRSIGLPALPWIAVSGLATVFAWRVGGWRLAILTGTCLVYFAVFGKWKPAMQTLSSVLTAAPVAGGMGLVLGIAAARSPGFERILWPILNVMQSMPHFSYLIPVAVFIGVGHKAGTIATILFAMPPMARLALSGLRGVSQEVREAGMMSGCTAWQMLWKVEIPAARPSLLLGVNQVIMQCLAMVVIASFVGAKGFGHDLLFRLQSLRIGEALEIGVAIVFMAITLDRITQALSALEPEHERGGPFWRRRPASTAAIIVLAVSIPLAAVLPAAEAYPRAYALTTAPFWDALVNYITLEYYDALAFIRDGLLVNVLIPVRTAFLYLPWTSILALAVPAAWLIGGPRAAVAVAIFLVFVVFAGFYERALITAYMVFCAVLACVLIGFPLGIWGSRSPRRARVLLFLCDTFQTFPSFIYLIPVIMLFRVGDVAAVMAVVIYATIPAVRYTIFGLRNVPGEIVEAGIASGCNERQLLWKIRMPLAFPQMMLGVNQTVLFALFMVIIAAFIGTRDLGQEIFRALGSADAGKGIVIGLCVSFMGLSVDRLISDWAAKRKRDLGLPA